MRPGCEDREIPVDLDKRDPPASDVLCFAKPDTWVDPIWRLLSDVLTDDVRAAFCAEPPQHPYSDDLSWLDDIIFDETGEMVDIKPLLAGRLRDTYRAVRAAHATRTDDLSSFYEKGVRMLRPDEIEDRVRLLFLNGRYPHATEETLARATEVVGADGHRAGRLHLACIEESLYTREGSSGHYLTYGSEYLYCLAMRTADTAAAKKVLSGIGRPTLFVCDVPMDQVRTGDLLEASGMMLEFLFSGLVDKIETEAFTAWQGPILVLQEDLGPETIVGHCHPDKVYDPLWNAW